MQALAFVMPLVRPAPALMFVGVMLLFGLSSLTLTMLGVAYDAPGGNALHKLHPSTFVLALAAGLHLLWRRDPVAAVAGLPERFPAATVFVSSWLLLAAYIVLWTKTPIMPIVDSFLPALAILVLFEDLDEDAMRLVRLFLHVFLFANACIGVAEFGLKMRLTPFEVGGVKIVQDVRSTALLGHPLTNAATSGAYALALFFGGDRRLDPLARAALIVTQLVALVPFGGRTAMVIAFAIIGVGAAFRFIVALARDSFRPVHWMGFILALPFIGAGLALVLMTGAIDKILERFTSDAGSADARLALFRLFEFFPAEDILFGPDPEGLAWAQYTLGISYGIENSWLGLVFQYGAIVASIFIVGIFFLWAEILKRTGPRALACFFLLFLLTSSAASLSVKTTQFTQFTIIVLAMFQRTSGRGSA